MFLLFLGRFSPWPLPKLLYSYSTYLYSKSWTAVLLSFYLFKAFYVLLFHYFGEGKHRAWFDGLGNYDAYYDARPFDSDVAVTAAAAAESPHDSEPSLVSVMVIDLAWALMGIFLAWVQSSVIENNMFFSFDESFPLMSVENWKNFYVRMKKRRKNKSFDPDFTLKFENDENDDGDDRDDENEGDLSWTVRYGVCPPERIFSCDESWWWCCCCCYGREKPPQSEERAKWIHRQFFWFYLVQLIFFGTPSTVVYTLNAHRHSVRSGTLVFYLVQVGLLLCFYFWNAHYHRKYFSFVTTARSSVSTIWSHFNATYFCWFLTLTLFTVPVSFRSVSPDVGFTVFLSWIVALSSWLTVVVSYYVTKNYAHVFSSFLTTMVT